MNFGTRLELKRLDKADQEFSFPASTGDMHEPAFIQWAAVLRDAIKAGEQIEPSFRAGVASAEVIDQMRANAIWLPKRPE